MSSEAIRAVLSPRSVAVIGATDRMQYGGRLLANLLASPPPGGVWPVNPRRDEVLGQKCYPSVLDVPAPVDLAAIIVPAPAVIPALHDCARKGVTSAIIISAGFAERADETGRNLQAELQQAIRETGVRIVGPNCFGVDNLAEGIHPNSHFMILERSNMNCGGLALLSHSGASAYGPISSACRARGLDLEYIVSSGNELDLDIADFIDYWVEDSQVRAILLLLEGIRDGRRFIAAARRAVAAGKPVVACKTGRSAVGARAASTHTAAMTGSWQMDMAAFRAAGITLADDYDDLVELGYALGAARQPKGNRAAVLSHSGGIGALVGDRLAEAGLDVPELTPGARDRLSEILDGRGWPSNPADVTGHFKQSSFRDITQLLLAEPQMDMLVAATYGEEAAKHLVEAHQTSEKPVLVLYTEGPSHGPAGLEALRRGGVPLFYQPGKVARAAQALAQFAEARRRFSAPEAPSDGARVLLGPEPLAEAEALALLKDAGVPVVPHARCASLSDALKAAEQLGYPVVMKVDSPDIAHKTEVGGVRLHLREPAQVEEAYQTILASVGAKAPGARVRGVVVAKMVGGGIEALAGVTNDPTYGPVLTLGLGGVQAEALRAVAHRLCPLTPADADGLIADVPGMAALLAGFRGRPAGDRGALVSALVALSQFAYRAEGLAGVEINPLVVLPPGQGVVALDALIEGRGAHD